MQAKNMDTATVFLGAENECPAHTGLAPDVAKSPPVRCTLMECRVSENPVQYGMSSASDYLPNCAPPSGMYATSQHSEFAAFDPTSSSRFDLSPPTTVTGRVHTETAIPGASYVYHQTHAMLDTESAMLFSGDGYGPGMQSRDVAARNEGDKNKRWASGYFATQGIKRKVNAEGLYECCVCGRTYRRRPCLRRHLRTVHEKPREKPNNAQRLQGQSMLARWC
ncbi:hypothetical protein DPSP01_010021 [Paraphaeosphaeria sporulosa]